MLFHPGILISRREHDTMQTNVDGSSIRVLCNFFGCWKHRKNYGRARSPAYTGELHLLCDITCMASKLQWWQNNHCNRQ